MENLLTATNLAKSYGTTRALQSCSLHIPQGAVYALVGADGAGKSTMLKVLSGREKPLTGSCIFSGALTGIRRVKKEGIGYVPAFPCYMGRKTCREVLSGARRVPAEKVTEVLEIAELGKEADMQAAYLSAGAQIRLEAARELLADPKLLLVDEPFRGLCAADRRSLQLFFLKLQTSYGITLMLTCSSANEPGDLPTHYGFLKNGRLLGEYTAQTIHSSALLRVSSAQRASELLEGHVKTLTESDDLLRIFGAEDLTAIAASLGEAGICILPPYGDFRLHPSVTSGKGALTWAVC